MKSKCNDGNIIPSSGGDRDELAAAGAWMYKATGQQQYLADAESEYLAGTAWGFNWNDDNVGASVGYYAKVITLLWFKSCGGGWVCVCGKAGYK